MLSSPSGAGKTTITKKISQKYPNIKVSISHTTRKPRPNEIDGVDYHFVSQEKFKKLIKENNFYEYAKIFDNYYGTSKKSVNKLHQEKYDVVFDIDWQGTKQLSQYKELNLIKIFILPPNKTELKKRLVNRNQDNNQTVDKRRIKTILVSIKKKSLKNNIDPKITNRIWKTMIWSYIGFERRNFKKK